MTIRFGKTVRRMMMLFIAFSTFVVGVAAFYLCADAAAFLFQPKQPTPETTQSLTSQATTPLVLETTPMQPYVKDVWSPADIPEDCENCIHDEMFGLSVPINGEYINDNYRYMLKIPEEIQALKSPPPAPNHGFAARLLADDKAFIYVDGSYDAAFLNSTSKATEQAINYLRERYGASVVVLKWRGMRLGKSPAIRYLAQYTDNSTGVTMVEDAIVSLRTFSVHEDRLGIIYSITLQTPIYSYQANKAVLEKILKRWRELELEIDDC